MPAPLIFVRKDQLSAIVPYAVAGRSATSVVIERHGVKSQPVSLPVSPTCPGIFTANSSGTGQGAILNQDGTPNSAARPAAPGSIIVIYATGEGQTDPPGVDGQVAVNVFPKPLANVAVRIGGFPARAIHYAGGAPFITAGVIQVNAEIDPRVGSGNQPVELTIGGRASQPGVTVAVQ